MQNLEELLNEKFDRDLKEELRNAIPKPDDADTEGHAKAKIKWMIFAFGLLLVGILSYFAYSQYSKASLIDAYLENAQMAYLDNQSIRGEGQNSVLTIDEEQFLFAIEKIREINPDYQEVITLLSASDSEDAKYYQEALWLRALAYAKTENFTQSKADLHKLRLIGNYQKEKIEKLLKQIK